MLGYDAVTVQNQIGDYHTGAEAFAQARFLLVNVLCGARKQKRGGRLSMVDMISDINDWVTPSHVSMRFYTFYCG